ncbi:TPR-like protein [Microthyrium microscopicum]|uniref:TPR-like protein n=1 Tax=Microthyrium microscopicum TaxID=703497 RepID=A0A6A6UQH1_9PEZI|nr:TPR-like protein [Microthyrium microscopicum]
MPTATDNPYIAAQLRNLVYYSLDNELLQTALFHAGRLHGVEPRNPDSAHLIALCHYRMGQYKAAYDYSKLKGGQGGHLGCAYIFAQSCLALQRFGEGATALDRTRGLWAARKPQFQTDRNSDSRRHTPDASAVNFLLGKLWSSYGDTTKAVEYFVEALRINPFLWESFTELCNTGAKVKAQNLFKLTSDILATLDPQMYPSALMDLNSQNLPLQPHVNGALNGMATPGHDPFNPKPRQINGVYADSGIGSDLSLSLDWKTPTPNSPLGDEDITMDDAPYDTDAPHAPSRQSRPMYSYQQDNPGDIPKMRSITTRSKSKQSDHGESSEPPSRPTSIPVSHKRTVSGQPPPSSATSSEPPGAPARRSDRLLRNRIIPTTQRMVAAVSRDPESRDKREIRRAKTISAKNKTTSTVGRVVSGNRKPLEPSDRDIKEVRSLSVANTIGSIKEIQRKPPQLPDISPQKESLVFLIEQYSKIGQAYLALSRYDCQVALAYFAKLKPEFRETPWVQAQVARAHFENSNYAEAEKMFSKIRQDVPSRTEDMELYSTVLWHLKKDVDLSFLSHELIEVDRLSPQAWCVLGNAFSLQGEHDQAVKCFKRATQLDPKFAYAFTLAGHEHVANEEFDKALMSFRNAISADNRHYNGWYGLGQVFEKLGKYEIAREHYINASKINPTNPVLKVCMGLVLEKTCNGLVPEKTKRRLKALEYYNDACELDPLSAKARFAKARVLLILRRPQEAMDELEALKIKAPNDANVHFLLGKVNKTLGDIPAALKNYTIAMNLDPKATNLIKEAMDSLEDSDPEMDEDDDEDMD